MPDHAHENGNVPPGAAGFHAREIRAWAETRYGLITRTKLQAIGLSRHEIAGRAESGLLASAAPGVYYVGHRSGVPGQREALALAEAGPRGALSGASSAAWRGMTEPWHGPVQLIVPPTRNRSPEGTGRHTHRLLPGEVTTVRGLACVVPQRAVMDLPPERLRQALQWLIKRGIAIEPIVERMHGRRGAKRFREEVAQLVPQMAHTMSELEDRFLRLCARYGIPLPIVNGVRAGHDLIDCVWPDAGVVVELDGRRWHEHRDREDRARDRRRVVEGLRPLRYDWWDVTRRPAATADELLRALRRRG